MKYFVLFALVFIFASATENKNLETIDFPLVETLPGRQRNWTRCMEIRVLGKTCIELYFITTNLVI